MKAAHANALLMSIGLTLTGAMGCDGTLSRMHSTRGSVPELTPVPEKSASFNYLRGPRKVHVQHLVVMHRQSRNAPPTILRNKEEAQARAEEALAKLKKGADMGEVVAEYSDEPGAIRTRGDLGTINRRQVVRRFADAAFALKVGQLSGVVESEFGFHIIKRLELEPPSPATPALRGQGERVGPGGHFMGMGKRTLDWQRPSPKDWLEMHVHFIAVSGTGMGSLAGLFLEAGHRVSGSDRAFDPPMGPALKEWGVECREGFLPAHLSPKPDLVVIGNVCRRDNPLARAAIDGGLKYTDMAHGLAEYMLPNTAPLVVAGTHGKTTTSSMCAWLLDQGGKQPGFLIGGIPKNFGKGFRTAPRKRALPVNKQGAGGLRKPPFVIEGDEYDTAFFEKTPKFWHYQAEVAVITSIEHDHIDIYPDAESYFAAFQRFITQIPPHGLIVAAGHDAKVVELVNAHAQCEVVFFGISGEEAPGVALHWCAEPAQEDGAGQTFDLFIAGVFGGRFAMRSPGRHNLRNALAAIAAAAQGYGVPIESLRSPLTAFEGVKRRQDLLGTPSDVRVYDDFAHHPTAVRETLQALRNRHPEGKLIAVFEPRSATACRNLHQEQYVSAFDAADEVILAPLGRELPPDESLDLPKLTQELNGRGISTRAASSVEEIIAWLAEAKAPAQTIALLSNGAFGGIHTRLLEALG